MKVRKRIIAYLMSIGVILSSVSVNSYAMSDDISYIENDSEAAEEIIAEEEESVEAIAINETNFPDSTFRSYVNTNFNDGSGNLDMTKVAALKSLSQTKFKTTVTSLVGIEHFTELTSLTIENCGALKSVDLTKNRKLVSLSIDNCNILESVNISGITTLKGTATKPIQIYSNPKLKTLNMKGCTSIQYLNIYSNTLLTSMDFSEFTNLISLKCNSTPLGTIDLSNNKSLQVLYCQGSKLKELNLSQNTKLAELYCGGNNLFKELDLTNNPLVKTFSCISNGTIESLDMYYYGRNQTMLSIMGCSMLKDVKFRLTTATNGSVPVYVLNKETAVTAPFTGCFNEYNENGERQFDTSLDPKTAATVSFTPIDYYDFDKGEGSYPISNTKIDSFCIVYTTFEGQQLNIPATSVNIPNDEYSMERGNTIKITPVVLPTDASNKRMDFTCSDPDILELTVASDNRSVTVYAKKAGVVTITATTKDGTKISDVCTVTVTEPAKIAGASVVLGDAIRVKFYLTLTGKAIDNNAYLSITKPDGTETKIGFMEATYSNPYYIFNYSLTAKEMSSVVKAKYITADGTETGEFEYSVRQYASNFINDNTKTGKIVRSMLNYGAAAQIYLDFNTGDLANNILSEKDKVLLATPSMSNYDVKVTTPSSTISYYGASLILKDAIRYRIYFKTDLQLAVSDFTITADGSPIDLSRLSMGYGSGMPYVEISGISPSAYSKRIKVKVKGLVVDNLGVYNYINKASSGTNDSLKTVLNALYNYGIACGGAVPN